MKVLDYKSKKIDHLLGGKKIIPFGAGGWLDSLECSLIVPYFDRIEYIIDNNPQGTKKLFGKECYVYKPEALFKEESAVIILTSPIYMYEMYLQLEEMRLNDGLECLAFPLLANNISPIEDDPLLKQLTETKGTRRIPKIIHSFWFSGEDKPDNYQRCVDSWERVCPEYEIKEWNQKNYDCNKHPFLTRAIELGMWAFATDYARLDILYNYGGIYLDMDVEVLKPFDDLLHHKAIFSFKDMCAIDTAVFFAESGNPVVKDLLSLYDVENLPSTKNEYKKYYPASFEKRAFVNAGVSFNGMIQFLDNMTVVPSPLFMPLNTVTFDVPIVTSNTYTIHYDNFGWSTGKENNRTKKIRDNRKLRDLIDYRLSKA